MIKAGSTSQSVRIKILDSSSTTGAGLTGLVYNSAGLTAYYIRDGAATSTAISLATMTLGTWASGGFVEVDATNMQGIYEIGIPDACLTAGARDVTIHLQGATNMVPVTLTIELPVNTSEDNQTDITTLLSDTTTLLTRLSSTISDTISKTYTSFEIKRKKIFYAVSNISPNRNVGADKASHIQVEVNATGDLYDFTTPDYTYYVILEYYTLGDSAPANQVVSSTAPTDGTFYSKTFVT